MSPTLRRAASRPATRTATRCTELNASARWPISSWSGPRSAGRLGLQVDLLAVLEPLDDLGSRRSAVSSAAASSRRMGRIREGGDQGQHHGQDQGGGQQQAVQPGPAVGGLLDGGAGGDHVGAEALLDRAHPVQLDAHGPNQGCGLMPSLGAVALSLPGPARRTRRPCRPRARPRLLEELVLGLGGVGVELGGVDGLGRDQGAELGVLVALEAVGGVDVLEQAALGVGEVLGPGEGDRGGDPLEQLGVVGAGAISPLMSSRSLMVSVYWSSALPGCPAGRGPPRWRSLLLALLLVQLDAGPDGQLGGVDPGAVDRAPLLAEAAQLAQAVLDLLGSSSSALRRSALAR